jgi:hypothetical protein
VARVVGEETLEESVAAHCALGQVRDPQRTAGSTHQTKANVTTKDGAAGKKERMGEAGSEDRRRKRDAQACRALGGARVEDPLPVVLALEAVLLKPGVRFHHVPAMGNGWQSICGSPQ